MFISPIRNTQVRFGAIKFQLNNMNGEDEQGILTALSKKFPQGTNVHEESLYCGETSNVTIQGPSEEAEQKIAKALGAAGFKDIEITPFQLSTKQKRIQAGLDILEG